MFNEATLQEILISPTLSNVNDYVANICDALLDLQLFVQLKKREKRPWRNVTLSKVATMPPVSFYTSWKHQKTSSSLIFLGGRLGLVGGSINGIKWANCPWGVNTEQTNENIFTYRVFCFAFFFVMCASFCNRKICR